MLRQRRAFVAALRENMVQLASTHESERTADIEVQSAEQAARVLHGRFAAAAERDSTRARAAADEAQRLRLERAEADRARRGYNAEAAWLEHWGIEHRLAAIDAELEQVGEALTAAQLDSRAWPLSEAVLGRETADALAAQLEEALRKRDDETMPLRIQRDRYAAALRTAHLNAAKRHEADCDEANARAATEQQAAADHEQSAKAFDQEAATAKVLMAQAQEQLGEASRTRAAAVAAGLVVGEESANRACEEAVRAASEEHARAEAKDEESADAARAAHVAVADRTGAQQDVAAAELRRGSALKTLDEHRREHAEVAALPGFAAVIESGEADLHAGVRVLAASLHERISSLETEQRAVERHLDEIRRDLQALADGNLLAPRADVGTALEALDSHGIQALSGFAYLNHAAPAAGRQRLVSLHPHLADGIVLTNPADDLDQALAALTDAEHAPTFPLVLARADELLAEGAEPAWRIWGGDEALYDDAAAATRKQTLEDQASRLAERAAELVRTAEEGRQAATALEGMTRRWPQERLEQLRSEQAAAEQDCKTAQHRVEEAEDSLQAGLAAQEAAQAAAKAARARASEHLRRAQALRPAAAAELAAADASERAERQHKILGAAIRDANSQTAAARSCRAHARLGGAAVASRGSHERCFALSEARSESQKHDTRIHSEPQDVAARAGELAHEPAAGTPEGRARQAQAAAKAADIHGSRRRQLDGERGSMRAHLERVAADRTAPPELPTDLAHAEQLREAAIANSGGQRALSASLDRRVGELADAKQAAEHDAEVFRSLVDPVLKTLDNQDPYDASTGEAKSERDAERERREDLLAERSRRRQDVDAARRAVASQLSDPAGAHAQDLVDKLRRQDEDQLAVHAAELTEDLADNVALIEARLAGLGTDYELIVSFLEPRVADAIARLRALQRTSRLPATLGAWGDREFLTFRFDPPGDAARRRALVEKALDEMLQSQNSPDGFKLLLQAVLTVLGRVRVLVLKPEPGLPSAQPIPVSGLSDLSGGERATIAILLYCALSNLRRDTLSRSDQLAAVSTLLLDNPLGKASSGFLVDQQMQMASALGMQLIYATAIEDANALGPVPGARPTAKPPRPDPLDALRPPRRTAGPDHR